MAVIDPVSAVFGGLNAGLGIFGAFASAAAQEQEQLNENARQAANMKFALWQAGLNKRVADANSQHKYWADTVNYNQQLAYTHSLRNFELMRSIKQAEVVTQNRTATTAAFMRDSSAVGQQYQEASMQDAVAMLQYRWRALQARSSVQAIGQEGRSVDRIVNDYARQVGDYETLMSINQGIRSRQYTREQAGQLAQYLDRWNSQQFYEEQQYIDPVAPFTPLPALLTPGGPSFTGSGPSGAALGLNIGTAVLGGVQSAFSMQNSINAMKTPVSAVGPGTSTTKLAYSGINLMGN